MKGPFTVPREPPGMLRSPQMSLNLDVRTAVPGSDSLGFGSSEDPRTGCGCGQEQSGKASWMRGLRQGV